jgi:phosphopantetheinyl transferase
MLLAACTVELGLERHVSAWCAPVMVLLPHMAVLDETDKAHAARFRQQEDRDRVTAARVLLRHALTYKASEIVPEAWHFRMGPNGKPLMAEGLPPLHFSLAHAADAVAVAVSTEYPAGIDIEPIGPEDKTGIIPDVLSAGEIASLDARDEDGRWMEFMRIWTLKEACAKAMGLGVTFDFRRMEVEPGSSKVRIAGHPPGPEIRASNTTVERSGRPYSLSVAWAGTKSCS